MKAKNKIWDLIVRVEYHLCPEYCGLVDRRRVIAFLFLTMIEAVIIPYHIVLYLALQVMGGQVLNLIHIILFGILQYNVWKRKVAFKKGLSLVYLLVFVKLAADCIMCLCYGSMENMLSVLGNIFIIFILAITAMSMLLTRASVIITACLVPIVALTIIHTDMQVLIFSSKALLVGFAMVLYVYTYNVNSVVEKLRQPKRLQESEKKALDILADLKDNDEERVANLLSRLTPKQQQNIIERAAEHLKNRELDYMAWDRVCCELTKSEKEICQLILKGKTLKEICLELGKSESNITSQRSHIRRKLNMERKDDLKRVLQQRFFAARMNVDKLPQVEKIESEPLPAPPPLV